MVISESPKVEEIDKGEFEMSTEKQKPCLNDGESRPDSSLLDNSQIDQSMMSDNGKTAKHKKAKKSAEAGKTILDENGEPTNFIRGYSDESFTCASVRDALQEFMAKPPAEQNID